MPGKEGPISAVATGPHSPAMAAERLRHALTTADLGALGDLYADGGLLDASLAGGRSRAAGPAGIIELLGSSFPGPGRLVEWSTQLYPSGIAVWLERVSDAGTVRQRHYLRLRDGRVERHWASAAPPRTRRADARD